MFSERKEGRRERRKEGRKEGREEGWVCSGGEKP